MRIIDGRLDGGRFSGYVIADVPSWYLESVLPFQPINSTLCTAICTTLKERERDPDKEPDDYDWKYPSSVRQRRDSPHR